MLMHFRGLESGSFVFNMVHLESAECLEGWLSC
jgi:hypothetical protein